MLGFFLALGGAIGVWIIGGSKEMILIAAAVYFLLGLSLDFLTCLIRWRDWGYRDRERRLRWRGLRYVLSFRLIPQHQTTCDGCGNFYCGDGLHPQCPYCGHPASWIGTQEKLESYLEYEKNWAREKGDGL